MTPLTLIVHGVFFVAALAAYVVLTVAGFDGNPVFTFTAGQLVGAGVQAAAGKPPQV